MFVRICVCFSVLVVACSLALAEFPQKSVVFTDLDGQKHTPLSNQNYQATILFFLLPDCPISNAYSPEIKRICTEYAEQKIAAFVVYVDTDLSVAAAKKHAMDYGLTCPVIRDPLLQLVEKTGVTITPEVAVLGPEGNRLYRGRIDNLYADFGKRRPKPTEHDLRDALDAIINHKPVAHETTKAIGCFISKPAVKDKSRE